MTLRFKFTIFFCLLLSAILSISIIAIYWLYASMRTDDFNKRLLAQAYYSYSSFYKMPVSRKIAELINQYHPNTLLQQKVLILDSSYHVQYASDGTHPMPDISLLQKAKQQAVYFEKAGTDFVILYIGDKHFPGYIEVSGYDKFGYKRLLNLKMILTSVSMAGILLITICVLFLVKQVTKPLTELGVQMQRISESNLQERVKVKTGRVHYEQAQIATQFNAMLERLETAFDLQRSFVHHASHELRTPLATMLAQTESALRKDLTVEEAKKVLESLKEDQQEMIELTNSLLLLSQYEKVTLSPEWPLLRLDELLYETLSMVKRMLPGVNVSLEFAQIPDNDLFLSIRGNDSLIRSAFRNLIKNAWLYSDDKSVAVLIDATNTEIFLHFSNNGKLLNSGEQERLFIPFFRASNSVQKKGFGLGLNIIQRIVALHKGSIVYSTYNDLNRFTLAFPKMHA